MDRRRAAAALLALAACISCSAAAPTAGNHTALELHEGSVEGCYYNFQHYGEGDRIMTNEPCLNCTCHNRMLMCYLRVCPFTKAIGQDCTVEKRADQCCPIVTCPDVPVDLLTSTSTSSPAEYGATGIGKLDKYGCSIHGKYFPEGSKVPPTPNKPCEHCYCIRNMTTCVMQECTLHVDGCTPIYHKDVCCPVRYSCDHPEDEIPLLDDMTTTVRPTPGFLLTTTTLTPVTQISQDCVHDDQVFPDGALIKTEKACEHCYCMKGDIVCVVQECGTPMENEGKNCTSLPPRHGQCCPDTYICEGDERVTDSTTEFVELPSTPPRRVGVEGSGYRNEPDGPYTEMSTETTDTEGSGEGFSTKDPQIDMGVSPENEVIDEAVLTTTESSLHISGSTEPDKGQNTIPDSVIDNVKVQEPIEDETLPGFAASMTTVSEEYSTARDLTDDYITTESVIKIDDESKLDESSIIKEHEKPTTVSSGLLDKTIVPGELLTGPAIIETDQKSTSSPPIDYATKVQETSNEDKISTEDVMQSIVTEKNIITEGIHITSEAVVPTESTTIPATNIVIAESTTVNPNINEVDDSSSSLLTPSRIPGEGDCLLNGKTYTNNTGVPSTNNCQIGCKCISSIIKCDPIICSPLPDDVENMNDCQPVYDTPNSCCPTYVCSVKETIPPESHSHMSGTESSKPITEDECNGNNCEDSSDKKVSQEPTICESGNCLSETPNIQKECESSDCKPNAEIVPSISSDNCPNGNCQILPVVPCEGDNCKAEPPTVTTFDKDLESTNTPIQEKCKSDDCKDVVQATPTTTQDCSDGQCELSPIKPCEGENCKVQPIEDTTAEKESQHSSHEAPPKFCNDENGCEGNDIIGAEECEGANCRRTEEKQKLPFGCSGSDCKQHDEPTIQTTEHETVMVTEGATLNELNTQKPDTYITTNKDTSKESEVDVTKQPEYVDYSEKQPTIFDQAVTEPSKKYDTEQETMQTNIPTLNIATEIPDVIPEVATTIHQTEAPEVIIGETIKQQETSPNDEQKDTDSDSLFTKPPKYIETETKESMITDTDQFSTDKPYVPTDIHKYETVSDEEQTKLPDLENEISPTEPTDVKIAEEDATTMIYPETITQKVELVTKTPDKFNTEKETILSEATQTMLTVTEASRSTVSEVIINKMETTKYETSDSITENEIMVTKTPEVAVTEKVQPNTEITETLTNQEDSQTTAPEIFATEKESVLTETSKPTTVDHEIIQTEIPELAVSVKDTSPTESNEIIDTDKQTAQTSSPNLELTTKKLYGIDATISDEDVQTESPNSASSIIDKASTDIGKETEKEVLKVSTPDYHEIKVELIPTQEPSAEEQTTAGSVSDEAETYVTKEPITQASISDTSATITDKPAITGTTEKQDDSYSPNPEKSDKLPTEITLDTGTESVVTERIEHEVTVTKTFADEILVAVTESITEPAFSEVSDEKISKDTDKSNDKDMFTKSPHEIETITEEFDEATTRRDSLYTSKPETLETKFIDMAEPTDLTVPESPGKVTKVQETTTSQYASSGNNVADESTNIPQKENESTLVPPYEIPEKQEKYTETPETYSTISDTYDKTTKLPELYSTISEEMLIPEKSTEKSDEIASFDSEKDSIIDNVELTSQKNIEELATTEKSHITMTPDIFITEPEKYSSNDKKLVTETPDMTSTDDSHKEPSPGADISSHVTESSEPQTGYPKVTQEIEQELSTKLSEQSKATEIYQDTTDGNLPSQFTYKDDHHQTSLEETSSIKPATETYDETSRETILENEKDKQGQEQTTKKSQTQSNDKTESDSTISYTNAPETEVVTKQDEYNETPHDVEMDGLKPSVSDEILSLATEKPDSSGIHESENTEMTSLTTQSSLISVAGVNNDMQDSTDMITKVPEAVTLSEQSIDRVTTESQLTYTSSQAEFASTVLDNKELHTVQEQSEEFLLPSTNAQSEDNKKTTELPMSLVTHSSIDHASSLQTTLTSKEELDTQVSKTTTAEPYAEDRTKTTISELPKQSTDSPNYHITQPVTEIESSSKIHEEDTDKLQTEQVEKTSTPVVDEGDHSMDKKTTAIPNQQTESPEDFPAKETVPSIFNESTDTTPISDTKDGEVDKQQDEITTVVPQMEKEPEHSHEQETPLPDTSDEPVTKSPQTIESVVQDSTTPSISLEDELIKETMNTEALPIEEHELATESPNINVYDKLSTSPVKDSSDDEYLTETTQNLTVKEAESSTPAYISIVSDYTEKTAVPDLTEIDHKGSDKVTEFEEKTTVYLDEVTEKDNLYTESIPVTSQKEIDYEILDKSTSMPDQVITQSISTDIPDVHHEKPESLDKDNAGEHISHSTAQIPEMSTLLTETQTEAIEVDKTTSVVTHMETGEPSLTVTEKEDESQSEQESPATEATADSSKQTDKKEAEVQLSTQLTPTTSESSHTEFSQTDKDIEISEEPIKAVTKPEHEFSETTPFLVELKEHTHQVIDESSQTSIEEILTTPVYEPQQTERGDQNLDVTDKYEDEYQTSVPIRVTQYDEEDKQKPILHDHDHVPEIMDNKDQTTTSIVKEVTEQVPDIGEVPTPSTYLETDLQEKEKPYINTVHDMILSTSAAPQIVSEKESYTTTATNEQRVTDAPETSSTWTEKDIHISTEGPLKSEASVGTTSIGEALLQETKSTTNIIKEESTTRLPITDKSTQPDEKPIKSTSSPPTQELMKPSFDDEINEGLPSPDFPPSGAGGYGQEPDYVEEDQAFGPGTCRYGGKVYVSAQQIPRDDPCDFCFCFRSDIICLQQSCPPPIHGCHEEPIQGFCCPRYECPVSMATTLNVTTTTTTTTTTLPPHFLPHAYKGAAQRRGCQIKGHTYKVGEVVRASSGPCLHCTCGGDGQMKCDPKACTPEPMLRQMIAAAVSAKRRR